MRSTMHVLTNSAEWIRSLTHEEQYRIGSDLLAIPYSWPIGMLLVRKLDADLWEVRSDFGDCIARVLFTIEERILVALHGFIKKSQRTPKDDLDLAKTRLRTLQRRRR